MPAIMTYEDFLRRAEQWENEGNHLMSEADVEQLDNFFADNTASQAYQNEGYRRAVLGDFSQFESVDPMVKGYLGAKKCYELYKRFNGNSNDPQLQQEIRERLMEVDLRTGFAFGSKDPNNPVSRFLKECERIANRQMLIQTLQEPDESAKLRLLDQFRREDPGTARQQLEQKLLEDMEQRVEIAKILFMNHLGKFQIHGNQGSMDMTENMAEIYTHGGRTMFILPAGDKQSRVMDGIVGQHPERSGVERRFFATHAVEPRTFRKDGSIASEAKELKVKGLSAFSRNNHKGMNASVGGLGQAGPNGKIITADGTNGHMYMHMVEGGGKTCGMMLVGFENAAPGSKGRLGHAHNASAKKAGSSAFLSDKSYQGKETGGRVVDLSGLSGEKLADLLTEFETAYRNAAQAAHAGDSRMLDACNELLTGKQMSVGQVKGMLLGMDVPQAQVNSVEQARAGHTLPGETKTFSREETETVPLQIAQNQAKKPFRVTQFEGLQPPTPPRHMKEPSRWDRFVHHVTFHRTNSYVNRYERYKQSIQTDLNRYAEELREYENTLKDLEEGKNPRGLKAAYDQAVRDAKEMFGVPAEEPVAARPQAQTVERNTASPQVIEQLENTLLDSLFKDVASAQKSDQALDNLKAEYQEQIRQTEGYKKLINGGDGIIRGVLNNPERVQNVLSAVTAELVGKQNQNQKQHSSDVPVKKNDMVKEQPQMSGRVIGG